MVIDDVYGFIVCCGVFMLGICVRNGIFILFLKFNECDRLNIKKR